MNTKLFEVRTRISVIAVLLSFAMGCDFNPEKDHVHSQTKPEDISYDGVKFVPLKVNGTIDEWFFEPEQIAHFEFTAEARTGTFIDAFVNGKVWRCAKRSDGGIVFSPPEFPPGSFASFSEFLTWIIVLVGVLMSLGFSGYAAASLVEAKQSLREVEAKEEELSDREKALSSERNEIERQRKVLALAPVKRPESVALTDAEMKQQSEVVRSLLLRGAAASREILVKYALDPHPDDINHWPVAFEWEVLIQSPLLPSVQIDYNAETFRQEAGQLRGQFSALLYRGEACVFQFIVRDHHREFPDPLILDIPIPPFDLSPKIDTADENRRQREAWRQEQYRRAEAYTKDAERLRHAKAEIDEETRRKFGDI